VDRQTDILITILRTHLSWVKCLDVLFQDEVVVERLSTDVAHRPTVSGRSRRRGRGRVVRSLTGGRAAARWTAGCVRMTVRTSSGSRRRRVWRRALSLTVRWWS